ncbi:hypothetical protein CYY_004030 [Polysphondylium violaceum]|uniref:BP74 N-terminal domain-containing protein n=1 Tax=Polysphondylium violaceum TaxID=133409 RepID=A0A8J4PVX3_9MYCE|nr:hypothetical protein CYY_004030 [Polysphondylium violaceum]
MIKLIVLLFTLILINKSLAEKAHFNVKDSSGEHFVIELTDHDLIRHARDLIYNKAKERFHVQGKIVKEKRAYNSKWHFHLDPSSISFYDTPMDSCCSTELAGIGKRLDEACTPSFLPNCFCCLSSSKVLNEIKL